MDDPVTEQMWATVRERARRERSVRQVLVTLARPDLAWSSDEARELLGPDHETVDG